MVFGGRQAHQLVSGRLGAASDAIRMALTRDGLARSFNASMSLPLYVVTSMRLGVLISSQVTGVHQ